MGILLLGTAVSSTFSQRSIMNVDFLFSNEYMFIDLVRSLNSGLPYNAGFNTGSTYWNKDILDSNGWATTSFFSTYQIGFGLSIPSASNLNGDRLVFVGRGKGQWNLPNSFGDSWLIHTTECINVTLFGGDPTIAACFVDDTGSGWRIEVEYISGGGAGDRTDGAEPACSFSQSDPDANGKYIRNVHAYRKSDETDFLAGKIFRTPYKRNIRDYNPSAIRVMDWIGGNTNSFDDHTVRFEQRATPNLPGTVNVRASLPYQSATWSSQPNGYVLSGVTGTAGAAKHGDVVTCRIDTASVRSNLVGGRQGQPILDITIANPGVAHCVAHPYLTNDRVVFRVATGMTGLDYVRGAVTKIDADHFSFGVNTTGQSAWIDDSAGDKSNYCAAYATLAVGSQGEYPIVSTSGQLSVLTFYDAQLPINTYATFYFDAYMAFNKTSIAGANTAGCWVANAPGSDQYHQGGVPIEFAVALVNEINAEYTAQGHGGPTDLWINCPVKAMLSVDPDYTSASNWPVNAIDVVINPSSSVRSSGYSALASPAKVWLEFSNETWNSGGGFDQTPYLARLGQIHEGTLYNDYVTMATIRSSVMVKDVQTAFPGNARVKFVLGMFGFAGAAPSSPNYARIRGNAAITASSWNTWSGAAPITLYDAVCWAPYPFVAPAYDGNWDGLHLATYAASWVSHAGNPSAQTTDINNYLVGITTDTSGSSGSLSAWSAIQDTFSTELANWPGKLLIGYEGYWDDGILDAVGLTTDQKNFKLACHSSDTWKNAWLAFCGAYASKRSAMPGVFTISGSRWSFTLPSTMAGRRGDAYAGGVENGAFDQVWLAMGTRNQALS